MNEEYPVANSETADPSEEVDDNLESQGAVNTNETRKVMDHVLQYGTTKDLMTLFDDGYHVDTVDYEDRTALMLSVAKGKKDVAEMLLTRGADVNLVTMYHDRIPMTALDAAREMGRKEIADLLVSYGAKTGKEIKAEEQEAVS